MSGPPGPGGDGAIPLGDGGDGMGMPMGGEATPNYPDLSMSSDHPDMGDIPEEGKATIHFHKHSHTKERHPHKPGQHRHRVHLKIHSIKVHGGGRKKVSDKQIAGALGEPGGDMTEPGEE